MATSPLTPDSIRRFKLAIPQSTLEDLQTRLRLTRWPDKETVSDWSQGVPLAVIQDLCSYWQTGYDWRRCEALLNSYPQFTTTIDSVEIYFLHVRSKRDNALPLLITHGWPGSVLEFRHVLAKLLDPEAHGGSAEDAFHLVVPALPGYGFSGKPVEAGWGIERTARAWGKLMQRLGYADAEGGWAAQGGDWGSHVVSSLGQQAPKGLRSVHVNSIYFEPKASDLSPITCILRKESTLTSTRRKRSRPQSEIQKASNERCITTASAMPGTVVTRCSNRRDRKRSDMGCPTHRSRKPHGSTRNSETGLTTKVMSRASLPRTRCLIRSCCTGLQTRVPLLPVSIGSASSTRLHGPSICQSV